MSDVAVRAGFRPGGWKPGEMQPHVSAAPLLKEIRRRGGIAQVLRGREDRGSLDRALHRGRADGYFTLATADRIATDVLGIHPAELWGSVWWNSAESGVGRGAPASALEHGDADRGVRKR